MDVVRQVFKKLYIFSFTVFTVALILGVGLGYLSVLQGDGAVSPIQRDVSRLEEEVQSVEALMRSITNFDWIEKLRDKSSALSGAEAAMVMSDKSWEYGANFLFGRRHIQSLVDGTLKHTKTRAEQASIAGPNEAIPFPEFNIMGITFSKDKRQIVFSVEYQGSPRIWFFKQSDGRWKSDGFPAGFEIRDLKIDGPMVFIDVVSMANIEDVHQYVFDMSHVDALADYKMEKQEAPSGTLQGVNK